MGETLVKQLYPTNILQIITRFKLIAIKTKMVITIIMARFEIV